MPVEDILIRICEVVGVKNRNQLASKINKAPSTIAGWLERGKIPMDVIYSIAEGFDSSVDFILDGVRKNEYSNKTDIDGHWISKINQKVGAGSSVDVTGIDVVDDDNKFFVPSYVFKTKVNSDNLRVAQVDGLSMMPTLPPGSYIIYEKTNMFDGDGLYVISYNDNLMVKMLQQTPKGTLFIKSFNPDYEDFETDEYSNSLIIGRVLKSIV